ncbi:MAG TPA: signal recognition particle receptor subunit alpha, partial [Bacillota bacterium]|nr:signal recognition particle receptor subunit alpha [Bacillota bacterium]
MSLFDTFKRGLAKTRGFVTSQLNRVAAGLGHFDDDMLDELEMTLIQADCGVTASTEAIESIRKHIRDTGDASREAVMKVLYDALMERLTEKKLTLEIDESARALIAEEGFDPVYGARPLRRAIQNRLLNPLA